MPTATNDLCVDDICPPLEAVTLPRTQMRARYQVGYPVEVIECDGWSNRSEEQLLSDGEADDFIRPASHERGDLGRMRSRLLHPFQFIFKEVSIVQGLLAEGWLSDCICRNASPNFEHA